MSKLIKILIDKNARSGNSQVLTFKKIVKEAVYPQKPENFSSGGMAIAVRTFEAYKKSDGNQEGLIDLMLFFVECGSQFTIDYGDMDEDFYNVLEDVFEEVLIIIKKSPITIFEKYKDRLYVIAEETQEMGWGYADQIQDLLNDAFPNLLKSRPFE